MKPFNRRVYKLRVVLLAGLHNRDRREAWHDRTLDECFENGDGSAVSLQIMREFSADEELWRAFCLWWANNYNPPPFAPQHLPEKWLQTWNTFAHVPTHRIPELATNERARTFREFKEANNRALYGVEQQELCLA